MRTLFIDTSASDVSIAIVIDGKIKSSKYATIPNAHSIYTVDFLNEVIKNAFCKIKYEEIAHIGYESIEFVSTRGHKKFGIILIVNGKDKTLKNCDIKKSICIPLNEKTKKAFIENAPLVAKKFSIPL